METEGKVPLAHVSGPIVVIGGGPAGLMAAGRAASLGAPVLLLERTARLGTKLRLAGGGRCNLTNTAPIDEFLVHFGPSLFLRNALARFSPQDLVALLDALGVPTRTEEGGRVFPASGSAHQVAEALIGYAREQGVRVRLQSRVTSLLHGAGRLQSILLDGGEEITASAAVVTTGGASYPRTGSTGDGYRLAAGAGHTIVPVCPALTPLAVHGSEPQALAGVSLSGVTVHLLLDGREVARAAGDLLFTHGGLSGPAILALSGVASACLGQGMLEISVDLLPALNREELDARLRQSLGHAGRRLTRTWLTMWAAPRLAELLLRRAAVPPARPANQVSASERERLCTLLQDLRFTVTGHGSWDEAMLTGGGVDTREVDPRTMESRLVRALFFAGEVLDVQADTGGFNLQAAFSTGYVAGSAAAQVAPLSAARVRDDGRWTMDNGPWSMAHGPSSESGESPRGN